MKVEVRRVEETCVNEAKRIGFMVDRGRGVELRIGDILVIYFSEQRYQ